MGLMSRYEVRRAILPSSGRRIKVVVDSETLSPVPEVRDFALHLSGAGRADNTIDSYIPKIATFLNWTVETPMCEWRSITMPQLARFKWFLEAPAPTRSTSFPSLRSRSARTVNVYLTSVVEFLRYCARMELIDQSIVDRLVEPRFLAYLPASFDAGESGQYRYRRVSELRARELLSPPRTLTAGQPQAAAAATLNARDRFLIDLLFATGMRIGEALGLRRSDMHFLPSSTALGCELPGPHVHVIRRIDNPNGAVAKSRRERHIPVNADLVLSYRDYQIERSSAVGDFGSDHVFVNLYKGVIGAPYTYSAATSLIRALRKRADIPNLHPHLFRHTRATMWIEQGSERDVVQQLLGHAVAESTAIYMHPSPRRLREAVERGLLGRAE